MKYEINIPHTQLNTLIMIRTSSHAARGVGCNCDEVAVDTLGRRLTVNVASPARDAAVASKRERVMAPRGSRDEVAVDAAGRRLRVRQESHHSSYCANKPPPPEGEAERFVRQLSPPGEHRVHSVCRHGKKKQPGGCHVKKKKKKKNPPELPLLLPRT